MSKVDIAVLEDLTAGSVWHRKNGKASCVLFVTNQHFPEEILRAYPQQVVYADEHDNVISAPVEDFVSKRKFYNVDPDLEQRLGNLLDEDSASEDFELGDSDDVLNVEDDEDETDMSADTLTEQHLGASVEADDHAITYQYRGTSEVNGDPIDRTLLASLTRGYSQSPSESSEKVLNTLFIDAAPGVDQFSLTAAFTGTDATYNFTVDTASGSIEVTWDEFVGVYPMVAHGQTSYQVMFYTYPLEEAINLPEDVLDDTEQVAVVATPEVSADSVAAVIQQSQEPQSVVPPAV